MDGWGVWDDTYSCGKRRAVEAYTGGEIGTGGGCHVLRGANPDKYGKFVRPQSATDGVSPTIVGCKVVARGCQ